MASVQPTSDAAVMLAQMREPLLTVLRASADFRPAHDLLIALAYALAEHDAAASRALPTQLAELQPARAEAHALIARLAPSAPR